MEPEKRALEQLAYNDAILDPEAEAPPREEDAPAPGLRAKGKRKPSAEEDAAAPDGD